MSKNKKSTMKRYIKTQPVYFQAELDDNALQDPQFNIGQYKFEDFYDESKKGQQRKDAIFEESLENITPMRSQYYEVKARYQKMIVLFQRGSFYQAYDEDAQFIHETLNYNWRNEQKMLIGIPEQNLEQDILRLIELGQSIVLCQQVEDQIHYKMREKEDLYDYPIIPRKIVGIYQQGVIGLGCLCNNTFDLYEHNYLYILSRTKTNNLIEVTILDTIIKSATVGSQNLDELGNSFTLFKPAQILIQKSDKTLILLINSMKTSTTTLTQVELLNCSSTINILIEYLQSMYLYIDTIHLITFYLKNNNQLHDITTQIKDQYLVDFSSQSTKSIQEEYQQKSFNLSQQALRELYVFPKTSNKNKTGSLFSLINNTVTKDGERLLIDWLKNPLIIQDLIIDRQQAIKDLHLIYNQVQAFREELKPIKDLQKRTIWLYGQVHQFYVAKAEISYKCFISLKVYLKDLNCIISHINMKFTSIQSQFKSYLLLQILSSESILLIIKLIMFQQVIDSISTKILWQGNDLSVPSPSSYPEKQIYDELLNEIEKVQTNVDAEIYRQQNENMDTPMRHRCTTKYQHEIEIQSDLIGQIRNHSELELSSARVGYRQYKSPILNDLNQHEFALQSQLKVFLSKFQKDLFLKFTEQRQTWNEISQMIAQIDVLCALMIYSFGEGLSFPKIEQRDSPYLKATKFKNPCLIGLHNEVIENDLSFGEDISCVLITGSNGSGKSTILRSMGSLVILAQIGCSVPCHQLTLSPFKQIYTRMGAYDYIVEGRSTFYQELLEIRPMIDSQGALLLIDELGRGTSTYDGQALAYAILKFLIDHGSNIILFTTHYHQIALDLRNREKLIFKYLKAYENGPDYKMSDGIEQGEIYKYIVSKVGLPECIIQRAKYISKNYKSIVKIKE